MRPDSLSSHTHPCLTSFSRQRQPLVAQSFVNAGGLFQNARGRSRTCNDKTPADVSPRPQPRLAVPSFLLPERLCVSAVPPLSRKCDCRRFHRQPSCFAIPARGCPLSTICFRRHETYGPSIAGAKMQVMYTTGWGCLQFPPPTVRRTTGGVEDYSAHSELSSSTSDASPVGSIAIITCCLHPSPS